MRENRCIGFINLSRQIFVVQFVVCFGVFFVVIVMLSRRGIVLVSFALQFIRASRRPWDICDCESTLAQGPIRYPNFPISYRKGRKNSQLQFDVIHPVTLFMPRRQKISVKHSTCLLKRNCGYMFRPYLAILSV